MTNAPTIECVLVSSLAAVPALLADDTAPGAASLRVELATASDLARVLGVPAGPRDGWLSLLFAGALQPPAAGTPPILLAPEPAVSLAVLDAAVAAMSTTDRASLPNDGNVALIAPVSSAATLSSCFAYVDRFHLWWDVADLPGAALTQAMHTLGSLPDMNRDRFAGVRLADSATRPVADASERREQMGAVLAELSLAA